MAIPVYLPYFVFAGTLATITAILYGWVPIAAWPTRLGPRRKGTLANRLSAAMLIGWLALSIALAAMGVYHAEASAIPTIQYGIVLPILIGSLLLWRSDVGGAHHRCRAAAMAHRRAALPRPRRDLPHSLRCGKAAGPVRPACRYRRHRHRPARSGRRPRLCSSASQYRKARHGMERVRILDLVVAVTTGFITSPSLIQLIDVQPNSELMTMLPMVLIPVYPAPLSSCCISPRWRSCTARWHQWQPGRDSFSITAAVH